MPGSYQAAWSEAFRSGARCPVRAMPGRRTETQAVRSRSVNGRSPRWGASVRRRRDTWTRVDVRLPDVAALTGRYARAVSGGEVRRPDSGRALPLSGLARYCPRHMNAPWQRRRGAQPVPARPAASSCVAAGTGVATAGAGPSSLTPKRRGRRDSGDLPDARPRTARPQTARRHRPRPDGHRVVQQARCQPDRRLPAARHPGAARPGTPRSGRSRPGGPRCAAARQVHPLVREAALPALRSLAEDIGATAHLTLVDGSDALAVAVVEPTWTDYHVAYRVASATRWTGARRAGPSCPPGRRPTPPTLGTPSPTASSKPGPAGRRRPWSGSPEWRAASASSCSPTPYRNGSDPGCSTPPGRSRTRCGRRTCEVADAGGRRRAAVGVRGRWRTGCGRRTREAVSPPRGTGPEGCGRSASGRAPGASPLRRGG